MLVLILVFIVSLIVGGRLRAGGMARWRVALVIVGINLVLPFLRVVAG